MIDRWQDHTSEYHTSCYEAWMSSRLSCVVGGRLHRFVVDLRLRISRWFLNTHLLRNNVIRLLMWICYIHVGTSAYSRRYICIFTSVHLHIHVGTSAYSRRYICIMCLFTLQAKSSSLQPYTSYPIHWTDFVFSLWIFFAHRIFVLGSESVQKSDNTGWT